jgi:hypothetical protein
MKSFWVTIRMGRSDILDSDVEDQMLESWLQQKLQHATSLLQGQGQVRVERVDPLRVDVSLHFTVGAQSVVDVMDRFKDDFQALAAITQGIEISETKQYKLVFPRVNGEQFPVFVRIDPDSGKPIYSED